MASIKELSFYKDLNNNLYIYNLLDDKISTHIVSNDNTSLKQLSQINTNKSYYIFKRIPDSNYFVAVLRKERNYWKIVSYENDIEIMENISIHKSHKILNVQCNNKYIAILASKCVNDYCKVSLFIYEIKYKNRELTINIVSDINIDPSLIEQKTEDENCNNYPIFSLNTYKRKNRAYDNVLVYAGEKPGWVMVYGWDQNFSEKSKAYFQASSTSLSFLKLSDYGEYMITVDNKGNKIKIWGIMDDHLLQEYMSTFCEDLDWSKYQNLVILKLERCNQNINKDSNIAAIKISSELSNYLMFPGSTEYNVVTDIIFSTDNKYVIILNNNKNVYIYNIANLILETQSSNWGWFNTNHYINMEIDSNNTYKIGTFNNNNLYIATSDGKYIVYKFYDTLYQIKLICNNSIFK